MRCVREKLYFIKQILKSIIRFQLFLLLDFNYVEIDFNWDQEYVVFSSTWLQANAYVCLDSGTDETSE